MTKQDVSQRPIDTPPLDEVETPESPSPRTPPGRRLERAEFAIGLRLKREEIEKLDELTSLMKLTRQQVFRVIIHQSHDRLIEEPRREKERDAEREQHWSRILAHAWQLESHDMNELAEELHTLVRDKAREDVVDPRARAALLKRLGASDEEAFAHIKPISVEEKLNVKAEAASRDAETRKVQALRSGAKSEARGGASPQRRPPSSALPQKATDAARARIGAGDSAKPPITRALRARRAR